MFVSDSSIFGVRTIGVKICTIDGLEWTVDTPLDVKLTQLKERAVAQFGILGEGSELKHSQFRFVHIRLCKSLNDENTITEEDILNNDTLLLLRRREPDDDDEQSTSNDEQFSRAAQLNTKYSSAPPILAEINAATQNVTPKNLDRKVADNHQVIVLSTELQKIVVTLIEISLKILTLDANAGHVFNDLKNCSGVPRSPARTDGTQSSTLPTSAQEIMSIIHENRKQKFKPEQLAVDRLTEMGFDKDLVLDVLFETNNNEEHAFDMLIGDRPRRERNVADGLPPDGPIHQRLTTNPSVILSLSNPKILKALVSMLETLPSSEGSGRGGTCSNQWLADQELAPLLTQVFRLYHAGNCTLK